MHEKWGVFTFVDLVYSGKLHAIPQPKQATSSITELRFVLPTNRNAHGQSVSPSNMPVVDVHTHMYSTAPHLRQNILIDKIPGTRRRTWTFSGQETRYHTSVHFQTIQTLATVS